MDDARAEEGLKPMSLPADFASLSVAEQLLVAVNRERLDRGLPALSGLTARLDVDARSGAAYGRLPPRPGPGYSRSDSEWLGGAPNGLAADYDWMYDDGPGGGVPGCAAAGGSGCWADRHIVLDDLGKSAVMGAASDPTGDRDAGDKGGTSLAMTIAVPEGSPGPFDFTWQEALTGYRSGTLAPRSSPPPDVSATHIPDPPHNVNPEPDYTKVCAPSGLDDSSPCNTAVLEAIDNARAQEGVKPMVLPSGFLLLSVPEQVFVVLNLERVDRGLRPFTGLTAALDADAQQGADDANDPPDPGPSYEVVDTEWSGGASNALDADFGWMYDDGPGSSNLDCPKPTSPGCWGHRHGILDNFGTTGTMEMGAAVNPTADDNPGDRGGTSIAASMVVTDKPSGAWFYTWRQALSGMPASKLRSGP